MGLFEVVLLTATFLCALVAGFLFAFAIVVMPGIKGLTDKEFIRAFQVMDGVIQNKQPVFLLVWLGSAVALVAACFLGFGRLDSADCWLLMACTFTYIFGVQVLTIVVNIPLNNRLQAFEISNSNEQRQQQTRQEFEARWNRANRIRTCLSSLVALLLMVLLFLL